MQRKILALLTATMLLSLIACGSEQASTTANTNNNTVSESVNKPASTETDENASANNRIITSYPKMEDIDWSFVNGVLYEEPAVFLHYKNNSDFTIAGMHLSFELKENITAEQLQLFDFLKEELDFTDEEIAELEPDVYDSKVCDPGEEVTGASCDVYGSRPATDTSQCELLELRYAEIIFIGEDNRLHAVAYSAENGGYSLADSSKELYEWSDSEYANMLPKPDTRIATVDYDKEDYFQCTAYDMNSEAFKAYIEQCKEAGFNIDVEESNTSFWGNHSQGYKLHVQLRTYDAIEISLEREEAGG